MEKDIPAVLESFGLDPNIFKASAFGSGLIHKTFLVKENDSPAFILQQVNHDVFKKPEDISHNLHIMGKFLREHAHDYQFTFPVPTIDQNDYAIIEGRYFRMFRFITGTHTVDTCTTISQAYEAACQFGRFTAVLNDLRTDMLRYTIPGFHDLVSRYSSFNETLANGNKKRLNKTMNTADWLVNRHNIVDLYSGYSTNKLFKKRVTHHDTKVSNVLLDSNDRGVCVIDLDTVMPGFFISDVGDMIRTYVSPGSEEETNLDEVYVRKDFVEAIYNGYMENMGDLLSSLERASFIYAGKFMIYMQALRFYTDHLNDDRYYGARYEGHNLNRANNQIRLFEELEKVEGELTKIS